MPCPLFFSLCGCMSEIRSLPALRPSSVSGWFNLVHTTTSQGFHPAPSGRQGARQKNLCLYLDKGTSWRTGLSSWRIDDNITPVSWLHVQHPFRASIACKEMVARLRRSVVTIYHRWRFHAVKKCFLDRPKLCSNSCLALSRACRAPVHWDMILYRIKKFNWIVMIVWDCHDIKACCLNLSMWGQA
jgi:hypothetical protein